MRRARIVFGYDGTDFFGSQSQHGVRTVQAELQRAIDRIAPGSGPCVLAGRTDRGVHARGQVASVDVEWSRSTTDLQRSLNAVCPPDLVIRHVDWVHAGFHARFDAVWREYRYRIVISDEPPVLDARYVWWRRAPLDDALASHAARQFVGEHSFGAFAGGGWSKTRNRDALVRTVAHCEWRRSDTWAGELQTVAIELRVIANGFLPRMVRSMVSAIVAVGSGNQPAGWIQVLLDSGNRCELGNAAPPHGLALWHVSYDVKDNLGAVDRPHGECEVH